MPRTKVKSRTTAKDQKVVNGNDEVRGRKRKRCDDQDDKDKKKRRVQADLEKKRKIIKTSWLRDIRAILRSSGNQLPVFPEKLKKNKKIKIQSKSNCIVEDDSMRIFLRCDSQTDIQGCCSRETYKASDSIGATIRLENHTDQNPESLCKSVEEGFNLKSTENDKDIMEICNFISDNGREICDNLQQSESGTIWDGSVDKPSVEQVKITIRNDKMIIDDADNVENDNEKGIVIDCNIDTFNRAINDANNEELQLLLDNTSIDDLIERDMMKREHSEAILTRNVGIKASSETVESGNDENPFYFGNSTYEEDSRTDINFSFGSQNMNENIIETNGFLHCNDNERYSLINSEDLNQFESSLQQNVTPTDYEDGESPEYFNCLDGNRRKQPTDNIFDKYDATSSTDTNNQNLPAYYDCKNAFLDVTCIHEDKTNASTTLKKTWGSIKNLLSRVSGQSNGSGEPKENDQDVYNNYKNSQGDFGT